VDGDLGPTGTDAHVGLYDGYDRSVAEDGIRTAEARAPGVLTVTVTLGTLPAANWQ